MKPILVFQHVACEGPGRFLKFARRHKIPLEYVHWSEGGKAPSHQNYSALLVLGGYMNVDEEKKYPWLTQELEYIRNWVHAVKPFLGLCLGGQLLAKAVGGKVTKNPQKEIGNFFVQLTSLGQKCDLFAGFPKEFPVFQWHGDTFSDIAGGDLLAKSDLCKHQAFRYGRSAYGVQFHLETTGEMAWEWLSKYDAEVAAEKLDPKTILRHFEAYEFNYSSLSEKFFENFINLLDTEADVDYIL